ncbi:hypothetical protein EV368DRAFT_66071 [Lentinula lateritia]|uniref:Uncharacterized protein n=1 Tax=Lentinula aff. lateritia TaxID=2804960 RepID=A0ACC1TJG4_9AGAR|nr:hypothetical protein F5876DRAFT_70326 [Lentinula aff. lateritia]KAJ3851059.1 hypothetical protein EV368DRAFT_66071 [Lentinula lateritia]
MARTTRSGAEFSPYELGTPIQCDIDVADLLRLRYAELDAQGDGGDVIDSDHELEAPIRPACTPTKPPNNVKARMPPPLPRPQVSAPHPSAPASKSHQQNFAGAACPAPSQSQCPACPEMASECTAPLPPPQNSAPSTAMHRNARQSGSHGRRKRKRELSTHIPTVEKPVHAKHRVHAYAQAIQVDLDAAMLPVNSTGFGGQNQVLARDRRDAETLCSQPGWCYIPYPPAVPTNTAGQNNGDGVTTTGAIPIVDRHGRMVVLIAGSPQMHWQSEVAEPLAEAIAAGSSHLKFSSEKLYHKRGDGFAALASGPSHGGGEPFPGNRVLSPSERSFMDMLLEHPAMQRASGFMNQILHTYNPLMYEDYRLHQEELHDKEPHLRRNFPNSIWSSLTVNCGPQSVTNPHVDGRNRPDGWCPVLSLGPFNHRLGGQLVLPDLKLVIEFPPGCVIFLPSALLVHYNCPIQAGERRYSITQYTAGGLFRWVANGFQTQEAFLARATAAEKKKWRLNRATRWEHGLRFFPVIV